MDEGNHLLTYTCKKCLVEKPWSEYYKANGTKTGYHSSCKSCYKKRVSNYKLENYDTVLKRQRSYYTRNKDKVLARNKEYAERKPDVLRKAKDNWKRKNPSAVVALTAKRRSSKLKATPLWLSESQLKEIKDYYWLAKDLEAITGETYHVDHIIPLQGKDVCGLHVPWNLQVLPSDLNISKGNRHGCSF
jgi:hypothetical protein